MFSHVKLQGKHSGCKNLCQTMVDCCLFNIEIHLNAITYTLQSTLFKICWIPGRVHLSYMPTLPFYYKIHVQIYLCIRYFEEVICILWIRNCNDKSRGMYEWFTKTCKYNRETCILYRKLLYVWLYGKKYWLSGFHLLFEDWSK